MKPTNTQSQFGGITLTTSVLYLSLSIHQRNRAYQSALLRQQSLLLTSLVEPVPEPPEPPRYIVDKPSIVEQFKDGWNSEIEGAVRWFNSRDWAVMRRARRIG